MSIFKYLSLASSLVEMAEAAAIAACAVIIISEENREKVIIGGDLTFLQRNLGLGVIYC